MLLEVRTVGTFGEIIIGRRYKGVLSARDILFLALGADYKGVLFVKTHQRFYSSYIQFSACLLNSNKNFVNKMVGPGTVQHHILPSFSWNEISFPCARY